MTLGCAKMQARAGGIGSVMQMQEEQVQLDPIILVGVLNACPCVLPLNEGKVVH